MASRLNLFLLLALVFSLPTIAAKAFGDASPTEVDEVIELLDSIPQDPPIPPQLHTEGGQDEGLKNAVAKFVLDVLVILRLTNDIPEDYYRAVKGIHLMRAWRHEALPDAVQLLLQYKTPVDRDSIFGYDGLHLAIRDLNLIDTRKARRVLKLASISAIPIVRSTARRAQSQPR